MNFNKVILSLVLVSMSFGTAFSMKKRKNLEPETTQVLAVILLASDAQERRNKRYELREKKKIAREKRAAAARALQNFMEAEAEIADIEASPASDDQLEQKHLEQQEEEEVQRRTAFIVPYVLTYHDDKVSLAELVKALKLNVKL